jgi:hypothetical protein
MKRLPSYIAVLNRNAAQSAMVGAWISLLHHIENPSVGRYVAMLCKDISYDAIT